MTARVSMTLVCDHTGCHATVENDARTTADRRRQAAKLGWAAFGRGRNRGDLCPTHAREHAATEAIDAARSRT